MKNKTETRYTADWVADVKCKSHGKNCNVTRKVLTEGTAIVNLRAGQGKNITEELRKGREIRIWLNGDSAIRLYPCLDKDFKTMFVAAQTMGEFRTETYNGIKFKICKRNRAGSVDWTAEEAKARAEKYNALCRDGYRMAVTPDPLVACPKCGFEFRVGKKKG